MSDFFLSPFWGQTDCLKQLSPILENGERVVLCGGYLHFSTGTRNVIDHLINLKIKYPKIVFAKSRFEEEFLIASDLSDEKNYHFKRWINPFSGIFSCIESYGLSASDYLKDPEAFSLELKYQIEQCEHDKFYTQLIEQAVPKNILDVIDQSIREQRSFREVILFRENLKKESVFNLEEDFLERYLTKTHATLKDFSNEY